MQTVSLMSGTSQPIPAHFVLMRSRHSLKQKVRNSISHRANQPSPQRIHDSFLLVPGVVTTELLDLRGGEVVEAKGIHPLLGPLRYNSNDQVTIVKIGNFVVLLLYYPGCLPCPCAVQKFAVCTFIFASLSDSSGRIQAMHLSTFLMRTSETQILTSNHNTYQMSTLL